MQKTVLCNTVLATTIPYGNLGQKLFFAPKLTLYDLENDLECIACSHSGA